MTIVRVQVTALLVVMLGALLTLPATAQQSERHLSGDIITGYSSYDINGSATQGPYVGVDADLIGYWKDPRILNYDIHPNVQSGFQWVGTDFGPQSKGVTATGTFLDGSDFPLTLSFDHQLIPTANYGSPIGVSFEGLSRTRQMFGVDWLLRRKTWPTFSLHYMDSTYDDRYPAALGGDLNSAYENLRMESRYKMASWNLFGSFIHMSNSSNTLLLLDSNGNPLTQTNKDDDVVFSAWRLLPLNSQLNIDFQKYDSTYDFGNQDPSHSNYYRTAASVSTHPWSRVTFNSSVGYLSSYGDYVLQQILHPGGGSSGGTNPTLLLVASDGGNFTYTEGATIRVASGLFVNGYYNGMESVSSNNATVGSGQTSNSIGGGLRYSRTLFDGQLSTSCSVGKTSYRGNGGSSSNSDFNFDAVTNSVTASYAHPLPWQLKLSATGNYFHESFQRTFAENVDSHSLNAYVDRRLAGWSLRAHVGLSSQNNDYPVQSHSDNKSFGLTATSRKLLLNFTDSYNSGLAYVFGNNVITPPTGIIGSEAGLPPFTSTNGNSLSLNATIYATKRLVLGGGYTRGHQDILGGTTTGYHGYNARAEYRFRQMRIGAGYVKNVQQLNLAALSGFYSRQFYIEIRRDFQVF
ncbi:MAG: hypothetical protein JOY79_08245 [Acidobacteriaceae bacterium]|nr:hypothetical protein [Acidobacteriaceae bacterium]